MKKNGFTILEILVVLAVLAILIGMAVPRIKGMQDQANISKVKSELKTIQTAIESYYINKNNIYPETNPAITKAILGENSIPQILSGVIFDPFAAAETEYGYQRSADEKYYVIYSVAFDGVEGTIAIGASNTGEVSVKSDGAEDNICVTNGTGCG